MTKKSAAKNLSPKAAKAKPTAARRTMEQTMRDISRLLDEKSFADVDEVNAFLRTLNGTGYQNMPRPSTALSASEEAQELAYEAMEARTEAQARKLAKRALAKDPDCIDALIVLTSIEATSPQQVVEGLQRAVAAGERSLGAKFFKENKGQFWGILETRSYMRARQQLAEAFCALERYTDAIAQYEAMLELNPNDNQGVREPLLGLYLQTDNSGGAAKLLKKYEQDASATFAWGRVLHHFLAGDLQAAAASLKSARKKNPFMELYMTAQKPLPKDMPPYYSLGSAEEAIVSLEGMVPAWTAHPEAMFWLLSQILGQPPQAKPGRRGNKPPVQ